MRCELGGVHHDAGPVLVGQRGEGPDGEDFAGHVGGAGDGQQADLALLKFGAQGCDGSCDGGRGHHAAVRHALPRQEVGVVLDVQVEDVAGGLAVRVRQATGQQVQRVGGVAGEDDGVIRPAAHEVPHDVPGVLVDGGADL